MQIVFATTNQGKITELKKALQSLENEEKRSIEWLSMCELNIQSPLENQPTFIENALLKARHCAKHSQLPSLADDSGLCVTYLNGQPGIHSARYAGEQADDKDNYQKLLNRLSHSTNREAFFYCVIAYVRHASDPTPIIGEGYWHGKILNEPKGDKGFGYDPIFQGNGLNQSAALMSKTEKLLHSHRGKAIAQFLTKWRKQNKL